MNAGFDANFVDPLQDTLKCPVCSFALRDPLQTVCGHRICNGCYMNLQITSGNNGNIHCPVDQSIVCKDEVFPDAYAKREILSLLTYCRYRNSGCQWKGILREFEEHVNGCNFKTIDCPNGCNQKLPPHLLTKHLEESCPNRRVQCEFCQKFFKNFELEDHYNQCEYYPLDCPFDCGEIKIPRKDLQDHNENQCPYAPGRCMFHGCKFMGSRLEIEEHLKREAHEHLLLAAKQTVLLEAKNAELKRVLQREMKKVENLEEKLINQESLLQRTREQIVDLQKEVVDHEERASEMKRLGTSMQGRLANLEKRNGSKTIKDVENLKQELKQLQKKIDSKASTEMHSGPVSLPAGNVKGSAEFDRRADRLENQLALHDVQMAELNIKLQLLEATSYNGVLIWKIENYKRRKQDAVTGKTPSLYSPPFYASRFGYKMCARIYLNGDGQGKGSHISLFFVVMRSEYDALLQWPFPCKVTMQLLPQEGNDIIAETFRPDPNSSSFRRPTSEMNIASGCPLFASQSKLKGSPYMVKDSIFIKIIVGDASAQSTIP